MNDEELYKYLLERSYHLLSLRPRSEKELVLRLKHLAQKKTTILSTEVLEKVLSLLQKQKLLDDASFAAWLVESRRRHSSRGNILLKRELQNFGVASDIITHVLEDSREASNQKDSARKLLDKKAYLWHLGGKREVRQKAWQYLARHGFEQDIIRRVIDEWLAKKYNTK